MGTSYYAYNPILRAITAALNARYQKKQDAYQDKRALKNIEDKTNLEHNLYKQNNPELYDAKIEAAKVQKADSEDYLKNREKRNEYNDLRFALNMERAKNELELSPLQQQINMALAKNQLEKMPYQHRYDMGNLAFQNKMQGIENDLKEKTINRQLNNFDTKANIEDLEQSNAYQKQAIENAVLNARSAILSLAETPEEIIRMEQLLGNGGKANNWDFDNGIALANNIKEYIIKNENLDENTKKTLSKYYLNIIKALGNSNSIFGTGGNDFANELAKGLQEAKDLQEAKGTEKSTVDNAKKENAVKALDNNVSKLTPKNNVEITPPLEFKPTENTGFIGGGIDYIKDIVDKLAGLTYDTTSNWIEDYHNRKYNNNLYMGRLGESLVKAKDMAVNQLVSKPSNYISSAILKLLDSKDINENLEKNKDNLSVSQKRFKRKEINKQNKKRASPLTITEQVEKIIRERNKRKVQK